MALASHFRFKSPLRYPGGKGRLAPYLAQIIEANRLYDCMYGEVYAGGAGAALSLLFDEYARRVHLNDRDRSIYAFWHSVLNDTDALCWRIESCSVDTQEWEDQRKVQGEKDSASLIDLGFSTFYMNRMNRSGIILGGVIGGKNQEGPWKMDARFNRLDLIRRIRRVAAYASRISLHNLDAVDFLAQAAAEFPERSLVYADPPYFLKGPRKLYQNFYTAADHAEIADVMQSVPLPWVVSYDYAPEILELYPNVQRVVYDLNYSAKEQYRGMEVMFFSDSMTIPPVSNPAYQSREGMRRPRLPVSTSDGLTRGIA